MWMSNLGTVPVRACLTDSSSKYGGDPEMLDNTHTKTGSLFGAPRLVIRFQQITHEVICAPIGPRARAATSSP
jgi:hypothetical protein